MNVYENSLRLTLVIITNLLANTDDCSYKKPNYRYAEEPYRFLLKSAN